MNSDNEDPRPADPVTIEYTLETYTPVKVRLTPDQARSQFGLEGTPDEQLVARLVLLSGNAHGHRNMLTEGLTDLEAQGACDFGTELQNRKIQAIDGRKPGDHDI